jgi:CO/xanthine dehydrogenase FAD-binding subunit
VKWFDYTAPRTLGEAVETMTLHPAARPLAGGTDLLVQMRSGRKQPDIVVDVKRIPEMNALSLDTTGLTLGAAVPCCRIYGDPVVSKAFPALSEVAGIIGGTQIQGRASIGGNLCNAAPSADAVPLLIAMRAQARVIGPKGERTIAAEDFCVAPGKNTLGEGELLVSIHIPSQRPHSAARYLRFIPRNEMDIAVAGAGVSVELRDGMIVTAHVALASVAPTPLYVKTAGAALAGLPATAESIAKASELARDAATPITDMRGTIDYRKHLCAVLTRRALESAIASAKGAN